jgi:hypothetical protein
VSRSPERINATLFMKHCTTFQGGGLDKGNYYPLNDPPVKGR